MKDLAIQPQKISTVDLRAIINTARAEFGESEIRNDQFVLRVKDELSDELEGAEILHLPAPRTGTPMEAIMLTHDQALLVGMRESKGVRRKVLDKIKALESKPDILPPEPLVEVVSALEVAARMLNASESGKLLMLGTAFKRHGIDPVGLLPSYAVDAPAGLATAGSSEVTYSLTHLLDQHGIELSAARANKQLHAAGYLKQCERKKTNGWVQYFWSITEDGLEFGKNVTSAQSPRQTEPHWYALKFPELAERMGWQG